MTQMSPKEFNRLLERDGGHCIHCGTTEGLVPHHRRNRGMGGNRLMECASNVITVCSILNTLMESDPITAEWAKSQGWKLLSWQDPQRFPVQDNTTHSMWFLHNDYTRTEAV